MGHACVYMSPPIRAQGYLTEAQQVALDAMWAAFPASRAFHTDHDMLRFLRAREFHLDDAKAMYHKYLSTVCGVWCVVLV